MATKAQRGEKNLYLGKISEDMDAVDKKFEYISETLKEKGYIVYYGGDSKTDFGHSKYLYVNNGKLDDNNGLGIKVRVSDHSVSNINRMQGEAHFMADNKRFDDLMFKEIDYNLNKDKFKKVQAKKSYPIRFEVPDKGLRPTDKIISQRAKKNGTGTVFNIERDHYDIGYNIIDTRDGSVLKFVKDDLWEPPITEQVDTGNSSITDASILNGTNQYGPGENPYIAFYKGKRIELYADSLYQAQVKAAGIFKAKKSYEVNVSLAVEDEAETKAPEPAQAKVEPKAQATKISGKKYYSLDWVEKVFIEQPTAKPVKLDTEGDFFAVKSTAGYTIYEAKSGMRLGWAVKTLSSAIAIVNEKIEQETARLHKPLSEFIQFQINKTGVSPRYEPAPHSIPDPEPLKSEYVYHLRSRPFGIGTYPVENFVRYHDDGSQYGQVIYSKALSLEKIKDYELVPVATNLEGEYILHLGNTDFPVTITVEKHSRGFDIIKRTSGKDKQGREINMSVVEFMEGIEKGIFVKQRVSTVYIVENINAGIVLNKLYNQWDSIKTPEQHDAWVLEIQNTKFGTYGTTPILDVLGNFNATFPNDWKKDNFIKEIKAALEVPPQQRKSPPELPTGQYFNHTEAENLISVIQLKYNADERVTKRTVDAIASTFFTKIPDERILRELTEVAQQRIAKPIFAKTNPVLTLKNLFHFYENMPVYNYRDSNTSIMQQFSTPIYLGWIMAMYCNGKRNGSDLSVFESCAGNGLLVSSYENAKVTVNEIDPVRAEILRFAGYRKVTMHDASKRFTDWQNTFDVVITNPPFYAMAGDKVPVLYDDKRITSFDYICLLRALDCMKDDGRAAFIVDGTPGSKYYPHQYFNERGEFQGEHKNFMNYLYQHYNVDDVISLSGHKLYSRQGQSVNVRMILINGRRSSPNYEAYPPKYNPTVDYLVSTPTELYERAMAPKRQAVIVKQNQEQVLIGQLYAAHNQGNKIAFVAARTGLEAMGYTVTIQANKINLVQGRAPGTQFSKLISLEIKHLYQL